MTYLNPGHHWTAFVTAGLTLVALLGALFLLLALIAKWILSLSPRTERAHDALDDAVMRSFPAIVIGAGLAGFVAIGFCSWNAKVSNDMTKENIESKYSVSDADMSENKDGYGHKLMAVTLSSGERVEYVYRSGEHNEPILENRLASGITTPVPDPNTLIRKK